MCACVIRTASSECGSNGGSCQLRSRRSLRPWKSPQSTRTRALSVTTRYFEPVTVPTPPQNSMLANQQLLPCSPITKPNDEHGHEQREISERGLHSELARDDAAKTAALQWLAVQSVNVVKRIPCETHQQHCRKQSADSHRAWQYQQQSCDDFRNDDHDRRGPGPALVI